MYGIGGPSAGIGGPLATAGGLDTSARGGVAGVGGSGGGDPGELETDKVNERALAVVQRIQTKLTGRDFSDAPGVLSVKDQVCAPSPPSRLGIEMILRLSKHSIYFSVSSPLFPLRPRVLGSSSTAYFFFANHSLATVSLLLCLPRPHGHVPSMLFIPAPSNLPCLSECDTAGTPMVTMMTMMMMM